VNAEIQTWYEDYQQKQQKLREDALQQALKRGRNEGARSVLLRLLRDRFGELPETAVARIGAAGAEEIERWGERVLRAQTLAEVLDEPS
jgi:hypothetical protein